MKRQRSIMIRRKGTLQVCLWLSLLMGLIIVNAPGFNTSTIALASETIPQEETLSTQNVAEQGTIEMALRDGKLRCRIHSAPQKQVLEELSRVSGVRVMGRKHELKKKVSMELTDISLDKAVKKILRDENYVITYTSTDKGKKLARILILSRAGGGEETLFTESTPEVDLLEMAEVDLIDEVREDDEGTRNLVEALGPLLFEEDKEKALEKVMQALGNNPQPLLKMFTSTLHNEFESVPLAELVNMDFSTPGPILRKQAVEYFTSTTHTDREQKLSNAILEAIFNRKNRD